MKTFKQQTTEAKVLAPLKGKGTTLDPIKLDPLVFPTIKKYVAYLEQVQELTGIEQVDITFEEGRTYKIANYVAGDDFSNPGVGIGGFSNPYQWMRISRAMLFYCGEHIVTNVTDRANINTGYRHPYAFVLAPKSGELAAINSLLGTGLLTNGNLAGGINISADVSGASLLSASINALGKISSDLAGSGTFSSDITGSLNAVATLLSQGDLTGALGALYGIEASLSGSSSLSGNMIAALSAQASILSTSSLIANITGSLSAIASLSGVGSLTADVVGAWPMESTITGTGSLTANLRAIANMVSNLTGVGTFTGDSGGSVANISATINIGASDPLSAENLAAAVWNAIANDFNAVGTMGEKMNDAGSASNPWTEVIEGVYTAADLLRLLTAVAAGKTTITDLGGGAATVTFRDINDTTDRIVATMADSERATVVLDLT